MRQLEPQYQIPNPWAIRRDTQVCHRDTPFGGVIVALDAALYIYPLLPDILLSNAILFRAIGSGF
jgi:hypothetical protein